MITLKQPFGFEWDGGNSSKNQLKHNVSNNECEEVFADNEKVVMRDPKHSESELRYVIIGYTEERRLLLIIFTMRKNDLVLRVISARDINRKERKLYEKANK